MPAEITATGATWPPTVGARTRLAIAGARSFTCATATLDAIGPPHINRHYAQADHYEAIFVQGRAEYRLRDQAIEAHTEITVSPEDDVVVRRVTLTNQSSVPAISK